MAIFYLFNKQLKIGNNFLIEKTSFLMPSPIKAVVYPFCFNKDASVNASLGKGF
ncbi:MAG TPA: hypothetical protein PLS07_10890 [Niabella sp.]|nr:hypothetical protein [Niabella sp.]HRB07640.1 hypothetical protein [Niabella sp.]HRB58742.1 hypothetical protein [Niabella sp.]HRB89250.1 hypothetical protein [Niabella sp.]HRC21247.1 hypothetical protein [Niabella sp.]